MGQARHWSFGVDQHRCRRPEQGTVYNSAPKFFVTGGLRADQDEIGIECSLGDIFIRPGELGVDLLHLEGGSTPCKDRFDIGSLTGQAIDFALSFFDPDGRDDLVGTDRGAAPIEISIAVRWAP